MLNNLVVLFLPLAAATGHQSLRASTSGAHLLDQIASSTPYHIRGTPQEDFDCSWRDLAWELAPVLQPWLNGTQRRQIFDALELGTTCKKPYASGQPQPLRVPPTNAEPSASAATFYVAPSGSDYAAGTMTHPFASISQATPSDVMHSVSAIGPSSAEITSATEISAGTRARP